MNIYRKSPKKNDFLSAICPAVPEAIPEWHGPLWPLNEDDIDLPDIPSMPDSAPESSPHRYIGTVRVCCWGVTGSFDMDVTLDGETIQFGQARLDRRQALALCDFLLRALRACDPWAPTCS